MNVGDIFWVQLGSARGHEQAGRRPAIVLQNEAVSERLPTVLMVPLTTQLDALRFPGTILIEPDEHNKLRHPSVALVFQLTAVDKSFLNEYVGRVSTSAVEEIYTQLAELTR